ncbi:MAG: alpha/beta hydrolase [Chloroflexi bacterium]|nr:MAG: alpha/beta hydrolase [Chloroflexota bacterium]
MRVQLDGMEVAYSEVGRGEPLVLIHGLGDDHRAWRRTIPDLMLHRCAFLYDLRGHGQTTLGTPDGTLRQLSNDLLQLMDGVGLEQVDIAGFSLGGTIAMRFAIDFPLEVRGLVHSDPQLRETLDRDTADVYAESPAELEEGLLIRRQSTADPRGYGNACAAMAALNAAPLDPELGRITVPTLIVASDKDKHCPPKAAEIIAAGIKGSRLEIVPGAGHPIPVERPGELAASINSFLAEIA